MPYYVIMCVYLYIFIFIYLIKIERTHLAPVFLCYEITPKKNRSEVPGTGMFTIVVLCKRYPKNDPNV